MLIIEDHWGKYDGVQSAAITSSHFLINTIIEGYFLYAEGNLGEKKKEGDEEEC